MSNVGTDFTTESTFISKSYKFDGNSYYSGYSSVKFKAQVIKWEECDTLGKQIGFIFGEKILRDGFKLCGKVFNFAVKLLPFDKIAQYFTKFMGYIAKNLSYVLNEIKVVAKTCFKFITDNKISNAISSFSKIDFFLSLDKLIRNVFTFVFKTTIWKKICVPLYAHVIKPIFETLQNTFSKICKSVANFSKTYISSPLDKLIRNAFTFVFKTVIWKKICIPLYTHVISPIFKALQSTLPKKDKTSSSQKSWIKTPEFVTNWVVTPLKTIIKKISTFVLNQILKPFFDWVVVPFFTKTGEVIEGVIGGVFRRDEPPKPPKKTNEEDVAALTESQNNNDDLEAEQK